MYRSYTWLSNRKKKDDELLTGEGDIALEPENSDIVDVVLGTVARVDGTTFYSRVDRVGPVGVAVEIVLTESSDVQVVTVVDAVTGGEDVSGRDQTATAEPLYAAGFLVLVAQCCYPWPGTCVKRWKILLIRFEKENI